MVQYKVTHQTNEIRSITAEKGYLEDFERGFAL